MTVLSPACAVKTCWREARPCANVYTPILIAAIADHPLGVLKKEIYTETGGSPYYHGKATDEAQALGILHIFRNCKGGTRYVHAQHLDRFEFVFRHRQRMQSILGSRRHYWAKKAERDA